MAPTGHDPDRDLVELSDVSLTDLAQLDDAYLKRRLERLLPAGCGAEKRLWSDNKQAPN